MRKGIALLAGVAVLVLANYAIYSRERLLTEGSVVLLHLAPVDPRSLITRSFALSEAPAAIQFAQRAGVMKVLLKP